MIRASRWVALRSGPVVLLSLGGCLAALEGGLDRLLSPAADGNIVQIAGSPLLPLARLLVGLL